MTLMSFLSADLWTRRVALYLPPASRHALLLTDRFLHTVFEPLIWRILDWDGARYIQVDAQVSLVLEVPRLAAHVRKVRLYPWEEEDFHYDDVERALKMMPGLKALEMQNVRLTQGLYELMFGSIVELRMDGTVFPGGIHLSRPLDAIGEPRNSKLETLRLLGDPSNEQLGLLTRSPALQHVTLICPRDLGLQLTRHIMGNSWVTLRALHIRSWVPGAVPDFATILLHLPELRSLHIAYSRHNLPPLILPVTPLCVAKLEEFHGMPAYAAVLCRGRPIHTAALLNFASDSGIDTGSARYRPQSLQIQSVSQERALAVLAHNNVVLHSLELDLTDPLLLHKLRAFPHLRHLVIRGYDLYDSVRDRLHEDNTPRVNVMIAVLAGALPYLRHLTSLDVSGLPRRFDGQAGFAGIFRNISEGCPSLRTLRCSASRDLIWVWLAKDEWKLAG